MPLVLGNDGVGTSNTPDRVRMAAESLARARRAASELEVALSELCRLGLHVVVRLDTGFEEGNVHPSAYYVEVEVEVDR